MAKIASSILSLVQRMKIAGSLIQQAYGHFWLMLSIQESL